MSILDQLQQKSTMLVAKQLVKDAKTNWNTTDISIFQFFVDIFGKEFEFTEEQYDEIIESTVDLEELVLKISECRTVTDDLEEVEIKLKDFLNNLINELFIDKFLTGFIVSNWVTFLAAVAENESIDKRRKMNTKAHLLLTFLLEPFTNIMTLFDNSEIDVNEELQTAVTRSVQRIFNIIPETFQYENYGVTCAKEYIEVLTTYHAVLLQNSTYLCHFRTMLLYDNRPLLVLAIKGIEDLCKIEDLEDIIREFLTETTNEGGTVVDVIIKLLNFKHLRNEVIECLKVFASIGSDIIKPESYSDLFVNLLSKSKKTIAETAELMVSLQVDFWLQLVNILNYYTNDDNVDIKHILTSITSSVETDPDQILKVVVNNVNQPIISRRGAEIFRESYELCLAKEEFIKPLIDAIEVCKDEEMTFILLLQTFEKIDNEILVEFLKENVGYLIENLTPTISNAFLNYEKASSLNCIVSALIKLYSLEPVTILTRVRDIAGKMSQALLALGPVEFKERETIVPKLMMLFECKAWRLVNEKKMVELYNFCQKHCTNIKYNYFPQFQRFYVNLLKHFWMFLATNKPLLIETEKFTKDTRNIYGQICNALKFSKNNIPDSCLLLSSLIDLHMLFMPNMSDKLGNNFFKTFCIQLSKEDYISLIEQMEKVLYPESDEYGYYKQMLIQSFLVLFKNFIKLPSMTSWEVFLRYHNGKSMYKSEVEQMMEHAISFKKSIFEKSVAFAVLNCVGIGGIDQFRTFFSALDDFLRRMYTDSRVRNVTYGIICSIMLERLPRQISNSEEDDDNDRLIILDCITHIIRNSDQSFSRNLVKFVNIDENLLTDMELRKLNNFKRFLANDESSQ